MSLKSYLQALLDRFYSKTAENKAEIAHLAAPGASSISSEATGTSWDTVAPIDGFVMLYSPSAGASGTRELKIYSNPEEVSPQIGIVSPNSAGTAVFAPVRKGQGVKIWGSNIDLSVATIKWFASIGGGA